MHVKIIKNALNIKDNKLKPIKDGVADIKAYLSQQPRIMWILKEPYDKFTKTGKPKNAGLESFPDWFNDEYFWDTVDRGNKSIYRTISTVSYNILHNSKKKRRDITVEEIHKTIRQIAFINMSKLPGRTTTPSELLDDYYDQWKNILKEQKEIYKPQIIIFGNTFSYFKKDFGIEGKPLHRKSGKWCSDTYYNDGIIFVDAYHPDRKDDNYVATIVKAIRDIKP